MLTGSMILLMFSEPPVAEASCYYILLYGFQDLSHHVTFIPIIAALGSLCTLCLSLCLLSLAEEGVVEGLYSPFVGFSVRNNKTASCVAMGTRQRSAESFQQPPAMHAVLQKPGTWGYSSHLRQGATSLLSKRETSQRQKLFLPRQTKNSSRT